jgi:hypothetical protein
VNEFPKHFLQIQGKSQEPISDPDPAEYADPVRSWLTALIGAEHLSLLVGSGLGLAIAGTAGASGLGMSPITFSRKTDAGLVQAHATRSAIAMGRGEPNIEDQLRSALQLLAGLEVLDPFGNQTSAWRKDLNNALSAFAAEGLAAERGIREAVEKGGDGANRAMQMLVSFLLAFASRPASRERLNVFTTNYDRLIEYGADRGGLRVLDRFVGAVEPVFRASRLELDLHYNPPGIRGEPRYLEGVVRVSKLHGSLDWRFEDGRLRRIPLAFGGADPDLKTHALERLIIFPNAAKDVETLLFPYAELFRDLSAAICRPNGVLVTFGYGFGDDHINRVVEDMLTIPSTHLLVLAFGDPGGRIARFLDRFPSEQHSVLIGPHFGDLGQLVDHYLPKPGSDVVLVREASRRQRLAGSAPAPSEPSGIDRSGGGDA